jgi:hypothetical protein
MSRQILPRKMLLFAAVLLVGSSAAPTYAATPEQCGDADANGARTVTDGVLVLRSAAGLAGGCQVSSRCDVDGNGAITVTDGVAALRLAAGLPVALDCRNRVVDLSSTITFSYVHRASFGYCPRLGAPAQILISMTADSLVLRESAIIEGTPGDPDCIPDATTVPPVACAKTSPLSERLLTADEAERVRASFAAIEFEQQRNPDCGIVPIEPCLIGEFRWDTLIVTDFACGEPRLLPEQANAIIELVESLR